MASGSAGAEPTLVRSPAARSRSSATGTAQRPHTPAPWAIPAEVATAAPRTPPAAYLVAPPAAHLGQQRGAAEPLPPPAAARTASASPAAARPGDSELDLASATRQQLLAAKAQLSTVADSIATQTAGEEVRAAVHRRIEVLAVAIATREREAPPDTSLGLQLDKLRAQVARIITAAHAQMDRAKEHEALAATAREHANSMLLVAAEKKSAADALVAKIHAASSAPTELDPHEDDPELLEAHRVAREAVNALEAARLRKHQIAAGKSPRAAPAPAPAPAPRSPSPEPDAADYDRRTLSPTSPAAPPDVPMPPDSSGKGKVRHSERWEREEKEKEKKRRRRSPTSSSSSSSSRRRSRSRDKSARRATSERRRSRKAR